MSQPQSFPGPIKVSQDGRYFIDSRGIRFFWWAILRHKIQFISPTENIVATYETGYKYGKR